MTQAALRHLACRTAEAHELPPSLLCGIVERESSWNPWAMRYEPAFERRYIDPLTGLTPTERSARSTSYGLMQVMGQTARENGFDGPFLTELCDPKVGLAVGCRVLAAMLRRAGGDLEAALLRYNGGGNRQYPSQVLALASKYESELRQA